MKIKIRTKEGEFVGDFPDVIKVHNNMLTRLWSNGIEVTETIILDWHGYEIIEQVSDDSEVTYPVQNRSFIKGQFKLWNFNTDLPNEDEGAE